MRWRSELVQSPTLVLEKCTSDPGPPCQLFICNQDVRTWIMLLCPPQMIGKFSIYLSIYYSLYIHCRWYLYHWPRYQLQPGYENNNYAPMPSSAISLLLVPIPWTLVPGDNYLSATRMWEHELCSHAHLRWQVSSLSI